MPKKSKKRKYCPYCQAKQRTIERLEAQLRNYEFERIAQKPLSRI
jgi:glutaredoxin